MNLIGKEIEHTGTRLKGTICDVISQLIISDQKNIAASAFLVLLKNNTFDIWFYKECKLIQSTKIKKTKAISKRKES